MRFVERVEFRGGGSGVLVSGYVGHPKPNCDDLQEDLDPEQRLPNRPTSYANCDEMQEGGRGRR